MNEGPAMTTPVRSTALAARYWPVWLALGALRLMVLLPLRAQLRLGRAVGFLLRIALPKRRRIAATNLRLCFPALDEAGRCRLLREHFASLGMAFFELGMTLWASDERVHSLVRIRGMEHLEAIATGGGVILLSGHFSALELAGRKLVKALPGLPRCTGRTAIR